MAKILVASRSDLSRDPRVSRQLDWLLPDHRVWTAATAPSRFAVEEHIDLPARPVDPTSRMSSVIDLSLRSVQSAYRRQYGFGTLAKVLKGEWFDLIIANDVEALPFAVDYRHRGSVLWDAHEYAPRQYENRLTWRLLHKPIIEKLCSGYIPRVDAMITVSEEIASIYRRRYGVQPVVIYNAPPYHKVGPSRSPTPPFRIVHHGGAMRHRGIESIIRAHGLVSDVTLDLYLIPHDRSFYRQLKLLAGRLPNVQIKAPVPMDTLVSQLTTYDAGVHVLPPVTMNSRYALPNKLFDFVQARLGVVVGPTPSMQRFVQRHGVGLVADGFTPADIASSLRELDATTITRWKTNCESVALALSSAGQKDKFLRLIQDVLHATRMGEGR